MLDMQSQSFLGCCTLVRTRARKRKYNDLRVSVGRCIASIDEYLLKTVYKDYPELDDLI